MVLFDRIQAIVAFIAPWFKPKNRSQTHLHPKDDPLQQYTPQTAQPRQSPPEAEFWEILRERFYRRPYSNSDVISHTTVDSTPEHSFDSVSLETQDSLEPQVDFVNPLEVELDPFKWAPFHATADFLDRMRCLNDNMESNVPETMQSDEKRMQTFLNLLPNTTVTVIALEKTANTQQKGPSQPTKATPRATSHQPSYTM